MTSEPPDSSRRDKPAGSLHQPFVALAGGGLERGIGPMDGGVLSGGDGGTFVAGGMTGGL